MNLKSVSLLIILQLVCPPSAQAQWASMSGNLYNRNIFCVAVHPEKGGVLYAGTKGGLFLSSDRGESWKRILKLGLASSRVNVIYIDPYNPDLVYAGTEEGVYRTETAGKKWKRIFHRAEEPEEEVLALGFDEDDKDLILVGTASGLYVSRDSGMTWVGIIQFNGIRVHQIEPLRSGRGAFLIACDRGLYRTSDPANQWKRIYKSTGALSENEKGHSQFEVEEMILRMPALRFMTFGDDPKRLFLIENSHFKITSDLGETWASLTAPPLGSQVSHSLEVLDYDRRKIFIPTTKGLYFYDTESESTERMDWGLPSGAIHNVTYNRHEDCLIAATDQGLFKLAYPETAVFLHSRLGGAGRKGDEILAFFRHEPAIQELQRVAIEYAEVQPEKISAWRRQASIKAWVPKLVVGQDWGRDENIDIDRGGTKDPDRYIMGPEERDSDFTVDLEWDLSEIIWNPDQTSIDVRSKLMVQLREDLLNQLTHLYFARRRLQIETVLSPDAGVMTDLEKQLRIEEYTAGIDALTGGYLSRALGPQHHLTDPGSVRVVVEDPDEETRKK